MIKKQFARSIPENVLGDGVDDDGVLNGATLKVEQIRPLINGILVCFKAGRDWRCMLLFVLPDLALLFF